MSLYSRRLRRSVTTPVVRAFTLVELLVVVGIIALLISILLPSLNSARQSANNVKCLANLHSIGQALMIYTGTSKGLLPIGQWNGTSTPGVAPTPAETDRATDWGIILMSTMGKGLGDYNHQNGSDKGKLQDMFTCPNAKFTDLSTQDRRLHYSAHPRLMPDVSQKWDTLRNFSVALRPYKLSMISRSSEIALIFDSGQNAGLKYNSNATATNLDQDGLFRTDGSGPGKQWNAFVTRPTMDTSLAIYVDNTEDTLGIRFRHNRNDTANALFVDGHCGSFRLRQGQNADLKMNNFYVDRVN